MTDSTYNETVWSVIAREYQPLRNAEERLARHAGATPRAARNWLQRQCTPNGENLVNLMAQCEALHEEITRLVKTKRRPG